MAFLDNSGDIILDAVLTDKGRFRLAKGEMLCFDNRRILHGRTSFNPLSGNRHLQGYYIEREEIYSKLNYLKKILV